MDRANAEADKIRAFVDTEISDAYGEAEFLATAKGTDILFLDLAESYKNYFESTATKDEVDALVKELQYGL